MLMLVEWEKIEDISGIKHQKTNYIPHLRDQIPNIP